MDRKRAVRQLKALMQRAGWDERLAASGWSEEWQCLIATLLSARTRDDVTIPVAQALFERFPTVTALAEAPLEEIEAAIGQINFFRTKAKNVKACAKALVEQFESCVPHTLEALLTLPGVGRKTANVFLTETGADAIGVDTHVARISRKLDWTAETDPHKIERDLERLFPKRYWGWINDTLVRIGRNNRGRKEDALLSEIR